jgi:hypothetical protein
MGTKNLFAGVLEFAHFSLRSHGAPGSPFRAALVNINDIHPATATPNI